MPPHSIRASRKTGAEKETSKKKRRKRYLENIMSKKLYQNCLCLIIYKTGCQKKLENARNKTGLENDLE